MGMLVAVLVAVDMGMGMCHAIVGMLVGMSMLVFMGMIAAHGMVVS
jgi:hypothetical protein